MPRRWMTLNGFDQLALDRQFQSVDELLTDSVKTNVCFEGRILLVGQSQGSFVDTLSVQESLAVRNGYGII